VIKRYAAIAAVALILTGTAGQIARADDSFKAILTTVTRDTPLYYTPGKQMTTDDRLRAGQKWYVVGVDATRKYARVFITEKVYTWVPVSSLALGDVSGLPVIS